MHSLILSNAILWTNREKNASHNTKLETLAMLQGLLDQALIFRAAAVTNGTTSPADGQTLDTGMFAQHAELLVEVG